MNALELTCAVLGAFAKFQKVTVRFVMSARLSVWDNPALTGRISMKFDI